MLFASVKKYKSLSNGYLLLSAPSLIKLRFIRIIISTLFVILHEVIVMGLVILLIDRDVQYVYLIMNLIIDIFLLLLNELLIILVILLR
mgnify:CR=1